MIRFTVAAGGANEARGDANGVRGGAKCDTVIYFKYRIGIS